MNLKAMKTVRRRYELVGLALVVGAVATAAALLWGPAGTTTSAANSQTGVPFATFTPQQAAAGGIQLTAPQGTSTAAEDQAARAAASEWFGGLPVLESHFAHCVDTNMAPAVAEDCWAVSLDVTNYHQPGGTPPSGPPAKPATYLVVLVQPGTDKILEAQSGS